MNSEVKKTLKDECQFLHFDMEILKILDDKHRLCETASQLGLTAPEVHRITNRKDLDRINFKQSTKKFILKNLSYDPLNRLERPLIPFSGQSEYFRKLSFQKKNSWVLQEFIEGAQNTAPPFVGARKVKVATVVVYHRIFSFGINILITDKFLIGLVLHARIEPYRPNFVRFY